MFRVGKPIAPQNKPGNHRPSLFLNFDGGNLDNRITFTRSTTATFIGSNGLIQTAAINLPRFDYDPITLACKGLLIEEQRTNLVLNSANLVTQNVTVTAVASTISFYGTGTVSLSGAYTGSLTGAGTYPTRSSLTFTPTAGTLILTVTGLITFAQLEAGAFATSYIPTVASQVTRTADNASMTNLNFSSWYNASEGTLYSETATAKPATAASTAFAVTIDDGTTSNFISNARYSTNVLTGRIDVTGVSQASASLLTPYVENTAYKTAVAYQVNNFAFVRDGQTAVTDVSGTVPTVNRLAIGFIGSGLQLNGTIKQITYYPCRLTNSELQAITT